MSVDFREQRAKQPCLHGYLATAARVKYPAAYSGVFDFADWDRGGRELMVELFDGQTKNLIAPLQALHDYRGGVYLVYRYDRSARFRINHIRGENVSLSGIFFGERKQ